ncbi:hypothetical protein, partial [Pantoea coffeiphila]|uniref:hypothetical protein n=1 Tax=Pantoea coffeiphila TaxID=1465635 RepID=UPI001960488C
YALSTTIPHFGCDKWLICIDAALSHLKENFAPASGRFNLHSSTSWLRFPLRELSPADESPACLVSLPALFQFAGSVGRFELL